MISLVKLIMEQNPPVNTVHSQQGSDKPTPPVLPSTSGGQPLPPGSVDYNISSDFSEFETKIANSTEQSKAVFLRNLNSRVLGKKVSIQASKGYGQPVRDYIISVTSTSLDYFYDRYAVIFKDENDKEYFLKTGFKITILGVGESLKPKRAKKPKVPSAPGQVRPPAPAGQSPVTTQQPNSI